MFKENLSLFDLCSRQVILINFAFSQREATEGLIFQGTVKLIFLLRKIMYKLFHELLNIVIHGLTELHVDSTYRNQRKIYCFNSQLNSMRFQLANTYRFDQVGTRAHDKISDFYQSRELTQWHLTAKTRKKPKLVCQKNRKQFNTFPVS